MTTIALPTTTWAALALQVPPALRAQIVAALRPYDRNDRRVLAMAFSAAEAQRIDQAHRRLIG